MQRRAVIVGLVLLGPSTSVGLQAQSRSWLPNPAQEEAFMQVFHSISSHDLLGYVEELSSPRYQGRLSGTPEYMEAARWVADLMEGWGIRPAGDDRMVLDYSFPDDYYPGSNSDAGTVTGEIVYVGYGIAAPELGYDDYAGTDVRGKIVVIDAGVPYTGDDDVGELADVQKAGGSTYYHDPRDTPDTLTPEIMEDVARLLFVGLTGLANDRGWVSEE